MFNRSYIWIFYVGPPGFGRLDEGLAPARTGIIPRSRFRPHGRLRRGPFASPRSAASLLVNMILSIGTPTEVPHEQ